MIVALMNTIFASVVTYFSFLAFVSRLFVHCRVESLFHLTDLGENLDQMQAVIVIAVATVTICISATYVGSTRSMLHTYSYTNCLIFILEFCPNILVLHVGKHTIKGHSPTVVLPRTFLKCSLYSIPT